MNKGNMFLPTRTHKIDTEQGKKQEEKEKRKNEKFFKVAVSMSH